MYYLKYKDLNENNIDILFIKTFNTKDDMFRYLYHVVSNEYNLPCYLYSIRLSYKVGGYVNYFIKDENNVIFENIDDIYFIKNIGKIIRNYNIKKILS